MFVYCEVDVACGAGPTDIVVVAIELPYESSPPKDAVMEYCPSVCGVHAKPKSPPYPLVVASPM